jgi:hypothetical protein
MLNLLNRFLFAGLFVAAAPIHGFASPAQSKLLPLIPREAQIVAGIEDPRNPDTRGVDETIWIAASSPQHELNEHGLLVAGRFDRARIFWAAEQNGAATSIYRGLEVLLVKPLAREERQMHDMRWMAILDCQTAVFGTPWLVQKTLDRYVGHESADPLMADRLERLHPQVNSWNLLVMPHEVFSRHAALGQSSAPLIELLGADMLADADELTLGIRYGSTARVDFVVRTADGGQAPYRADGVARQQLFEASSFQRLRPRLENFSIEQNLIRGSIIVPGKQLDACLKDVSCGGRITTLR